METWTESIGYVAIGTKVEARINVGIAKVSFKTEHGTISLVSVPLDDSIDPATVLHDLLTQAALDLENAAGMNAPTSGTACLRCGVAITGSWDDHAQSPEHTGEDDCACADKRSHIPGCHLSRVLVSDPQERPASSFMNNELPAQAAPAQGADTDSAVR